MENVQYPKWKDAWQTILYVIIGSVLTLTMTILTHLWLIPAQEKRLHGYELAEQKVSKLYQPILLATAHGNSSITSPATFNKVWHILEEYGHLADPEFIDKFIEFFKLCKFAGYDDLSKGTMLQKPFPENIIIEIIKKGDQMLMWSASSLEDALKVEKGFHAVLLKYYERAKKEFIEY